MGWGDDDPGIGQASQQTVTFGLDDPGLSGQWGTADTGWAPAKQPRRRLARKPRPIGKLAAHERAVLDPGTPKPASAQEAAGLAPGFFWGPDMTLRIRPPGKVNPATPFEAYPVAAGREDVRPLLSETLQWDDRQKQHFLEYQDTYRRALDELRKIDVLPASIQSGLGQSGLRMLSTLFRVSPAQLLMTSMGRDSAADRANRYANAIEQAAQQAAWEKSQQGQTAISPEWAQTMRGVSSNVPQMLVGGALAGPYGAVGAQAGAAGNVAITRGREAGLKGGELAGYAGTQAGLEALFAAAFQKAGAGGAETLAGFRAAAAKTLPGLLRQVGIQVTAELVEEIETELNQNLADYFYGVDVGSITPEQRNQSIAAVTRQTLATMGLLETPHVAANVAAITGPRRLGQRIAAPEPTEAGPARPPLRQQQMAPPEAETMMAPPTEVIPAERRLGVIPWATGGFAASLDFIAGMDTAKRLAQWHESGGAEAGNPVHQEVVRRHEAGESWAQIRDWARAEQARQKEEGYGTLSEQAPGGVYAYGRARVGEKVGTQKGGEVAPTEGREGIRPRRPGRVGPLQDTERAAEETASRDAFLAIFKSPEKLADWFRSGESQSRPAIRQFVEQQRAGGLNFVRVLGQAKGRHAKRQAAQEATQAGERELMHAAQQGVRERVEAAERDLGKGPYGWHRMTKGTPDPGNRAVEIFRPAGYEFDYWRMRPPEQIERRTEHATTPDAARRGTDEPAAGYAEPVHGRGRTAAGPLPPVRQPAQPPAGPDVGRQVAASAAEPAGAGRAARPNVVETGPVPGPAVQAPAGAVPGGAGEIPQESAIQVPRRIGRGEAAVVPPTGRTVGGPVTMGVSAEPRESDVKDIAAADIIETWKRIFSVPIRVGGFRRVRPEGRAAGIYRHMEQAVRIGEEFLGNLAVAIHEVGHHIDQQTAITQAAMPDNVATQLGGLDYDPARGNLGEGFAEWVRHYVTDQDPRKAAPDVYDWMETVWFPANREWKVKLDQARQQAQQYGDQSVFQRLGALIGRDTQDLQWVERFKRGTTNWWSTFLTRLTDTFRPAKWIEAREQAERRLGEGRERKASTYDFLFGYDRWAIPESEHALERGVQGIAGELAGKELSKPFWSTLRDLTRSQAEVDEASLYGLAKHTRFMHQKSISVAAERLAERNRKRLRQGLEPVESAEIQPFETGMELEQADIIIDEIGRDPEKQARYDAVLQHINDFSTALLDMQVNAGSLSRAARDRMVNYYEGQWFPLHRVANPDDASSVRGGFFRGSRILSAPDNLPRRSRFGSGRAIVHPVEAMVGITVQAYQNAARGRATSKLLTTLVPRYGGMEGAGDLVSWVDPKSRQMTASVEGILDQLVEDGFVEAGDAREAKIVSRYRNGEMPGAASWNWLLRRHGLDPEEVSDEQIGVLMGRLVDEVPSIYDRIAIWSPLFRADAKKHIVMTFRPGAEGEMEPVLLQLDPALYEMLQSMNATNFEGLVHAFGGVNRMFKTGAVYLSTGFGAMNPIRDFQEYQERARAASAGRALVGPIEMAARMVSYKARQLAGKPGNDALIELYERSGGDLFSIVGRGQKGKRRLARAKLAKTQLEALGITGDSFGEAINGLVAAGRVGLDTLSEAIAWTDAPPRLTEMEAVGVEMGYRREGDHWIDADTGQRRELSEDARLLMANAAANATINFKRHGKYGDFLDIILPLSRATLAAQVRNVEVAANVRNFGKDTPEGRQAARTLFWWTFYALAGAAYAWSRHDDDDYREQPEWQRRDYMTYGSNGTTKARVGKPRNVSGILFTAAERGAEWLLSDPKRRKELAGAGNLVVSQLETEVPSGGGAGRAIVETFVANKDYFRGRPIEDEYMKALPSELRFSPYTKRWSKTIGQYTGKYLGISPVQAEHLLSGASGGMYYRFAELYDAIADDRLTARHIPVVRAFVPSPQQAKSVADFYRERDRINTQAAREKYYDGRVSNETARQRYRLMSIGMLMSKIRKLESVEGRRTYEYQKYLTGLARYALGYEPIVSAPNPLTEKDLPSDIAHAVYQYDVNAYKWERRQK